MAPFHGTLEYRADVNKWPELVIKGVDGSPAYVLTLKPWPDISNFINVELVMVRPKTIPEIHNLLQPPGRWHGLQPYDFNPKDLAHGPAEAAFGATRRINVPKRKLEVTFVISNAEVVALKEKPTEAADYSFKRLVIDVAVDNLK